jgi:hypothetical protein
MKKTLEKIFRNPLVLSALNVLLCLVVVVYNNNNQTFCQPVDWAWGMLIGCFLPLAVFPLLRSKIPKVILPILFFCFGLTMSIAIYCIFFLYEVNVWGLAILPFVIGSFIYTPHIFAIQIVYYLRVEAYEPFRKYFYLGLLFAASITIYAGLEYNKAYRNILSVSEMASPNLEGTYMEEKILGAHFKYHTAICLYDGWRPPLHDPLLVVGRWLNRVDLDWGLERRVRFYHQVFPENLLIQNCACAKEYSERYFTDELLNTILAETIQQR